MNTNQQSSFQQSTENQLSSLARSFQAFSQQGQGFVSIPNANPFESIPLPKSKHIYLEQQHTYGRFIPYLLIKDQLPSELDSSGHSVLHHMCSHNSQYLPFYLNLLPKNDQILNTQSKSGYKPLDVAGSYCRKDYIQLLIEKGAIDQGNVDSWAIQGANIYNWSGKVDPNKTHLIHWAAYNDLPQVLLEFNKQGTNLSQKDGNQNTPMDLAVMNKSYKSIKALAGLGLRPKQQLIANCQSPSIKKVFSSLSKSNKNELLLKRSFIPIFCVINLILLYQSNIQDDQQQISQMSYLPLLFTFCMWIILGWFVKVQSQQVYLNHRKFSYFSHILSVQINRNSNQIYYVLFNYLVLLTSMLTVVSVHTRSYIMAIIYLANFVVMLAYFVHSAILTHGIFANLTHQQMFYSNKCKYLWQQVNYIKQKKILTRKFINPNDRGWKQNLKDYLLHPA